MPSAQTSLTAEEPLNWRSVRKSRWRAYSTAQRVACVIIQTFIAFVAVLVPLAFVGSLHGWLRTIVYVVSMVTLFGVGWAALALVLIKLDD